VGQIGDPNSKARALAVIASALVQAGKSEKVLTVAQQIDNPFYKARALAGIAPALAQAGKSEEALAAAQQIDAPSYKAWVLAQAAEAAAKMGQHKRALEIAQQALPSAKNARADDALSALTASFTKAGDLGLAREAAQAHSENGGRLRASATILREYVKIRNPDSAKLFDF
jgi:tetratricopeptide (TPR) repeat protein